MLEVLLVEESRGKEEFGVLFEDAFVELFVFVLKFVFVFSDEAFVDIEEVITLFSHL